jgi:hydrogenase-4 component B
MPLPGETRTAHFSVEIGDRFITWLYEPISRGVWYAARRLNVVAYLSIQEYLALVFAALVFMLIIVAL